jgi:hypothetical protein
MQLPEPIISDTVEKKNQQNKYLKVTGDHGILTGCRLKARDGIIQHIPMVPTSHRLKELMKKHKRTENRIMSKPLLDQGKLLKYHFGKNRQEAMRIICREQAVSLEVMKHYSFKSDELIEAIGYRHYITKVVTDALVNDFFITAIQNSGLSGHCVEFYKDTDEIIIMREKLAEYQADVDAGSRDKELNKAYTKLYFEFEEICEREKQKHIKEFSKIENICFKLSGYLPYDKHSGLKEAIQDLGNSNIIKLIMLFVKVNNEFYCNEINEQRINDNKVNNAEKYQVKKKFSASEKREFVQLLKAEGKKQKQVALELECCERIVRDYWK